jgi:predicted nucleic acid-binding protein
MKYLLDTSVLIAHLCNEKEADKIARFIKDSALPFVALSEIYYITWNKKGEQEADKIYGIIKSWNLPILLPDEKIILMAGRLKAMFKLCLADSYIASFCLDKDLTLLTKDKDCDILKKEIKILYLHEA